MHSLIINLRDRKQFEKIGAKNNKLNTENKMKTKEQKLNDFYNSFRTIPMFEIDLYEYGLSSRRDNFARCHLKYDKEKDELKFGQMNHYGFIEEGSVKYINEISMNRNLNLLFRIWILHLERNL